MPLKDDALAKIDAELGKPEADSSALAGFRTDFPGLSLTRCDESDMGVEKPFREYPRFNLYLIDTSEHCVRITPDPACATGVVIAAKTVRQEAAT